MNIDYNIYDDLEYPTFDDIIHTEGVKEFYKFLLNNNLLDKYLYNFRNNKSPMLFGCKDTDIWYVLDNKLSTTFIFDAFSWSDSPEGYSFWERINDEWYNRSYNEL